MIKDFKTYITESEKVSIEKELREYTLTHTSVDKFQLKSENFYKEFSVLPYKKETIEPLKLIFSKGTDAIESLNVHDLYSVIEKSENIPYKYGNVFSSNFSIKEVPDLMTSLDDEQLKSFESPKHFLMNSFSGLGKEIKDDIVNILRDRVEITCCVIEALFYYIRTTDKDKRYNGLDRYEIIKGYDDDIEKNAKELSISVSGPFENIDTTQDLNESDYGFWKCEKDSKTFYIKGTVSIKKLYEEDELGGIKGLKLSITDSKNIDDSKEFTLFNIDELKSKLENYLQKIKKTI